jgi:hypothetical protein
VVGDVVTKKHCHTDRGRGRLTGEDTSALDHMDLDLVPIGQVVVVGKWHTVWLLYSSTGSVGYEWDAIALRVAL